MSCHERDLTRSDEEYRFVQQIRKGDQVAFEILFERYQRRVYRQAMSFLDSEADAEETTQEVFMTLYEKAETFRGVAAFSTWLYRITANAALSKLRHRQRYRERLVGDRRFVHQESLERLDRLWAARPIDPERLAIRTESRHLLEQALDGLRPLDKAVVVLCELTGFSNRETGYALGLTISAVKMRRYRARQLLRKRLETKYVSRAARLSHNTSKLR